MQTLSQSFLDSCSRQKGYILRGENMTRIETFVDAAFAFAFTMLIISVDEIPNSVETLFASAKDIPAFLVSCINIGFIWYSHSVFSRRFGLQDGKTIILSLSLVMLVLVFIYPLKLVFMGLFHWLSGGYLSSGLGSMTEMQLSDLFVFFAVGMLMLAIISYLMLKNVLRQAYFLGLTEFEIYSSKTDLIYWIIVVFISFLAILLAKTLSGLWITSSGFVYFLLYFSAKVLQKHRARNEPAKE